MDSDQLELLPVTPPYAGPSVADPQKLLWALGDPLRWKIVRELADGSALTVLDLARRLRRDANLVSKHMRPLRESGAVTVREIPGEDRRKSHYEVPPWTREGATIGARRVDYGCCLLRF
jgi:DNA-binding transcriptional ArsR family regulator